MTSSGNEGPAEDLGPHRAGLRVLQVVMGLDPQIGGPVSSLTTAVEAETVGGHDVTVLCCEGDSDGGGGGRWLLGLKRLEDAGARVVALPRARRPAHTAAKFGVAPGALRWMTRHASQFDVVHVRSVWGWLAMAAVVGARARGVAVVLTPHESLTSFDVTTSSSRALAFTKRVLRPLVIRAVHGLILTSSREREDSGLGRDPRAVVVPHAVRMPDRPIARSTAQAGEIRLGFLGRIHQKKNLHVAIDAVALDPRFSLVVAGRGAEPLLLSLADRARKRRVDGRVTWLDFISVESRPSFFAGIDVLVLPSAYENFGMAAAEAMAHGVPVVTTVTTGISEVIQRYGGGVVAEGTGESVATAALRLVGGEPGIGDAAEVARNQLSQDAYARGVSALYLAAMARAAQ